MDSICISKFKATCLALLDEVGRTGRPLLVTKRGVPVALVGPPPRPAPEPQSAYGCMAEGTVEVGDILEPLPAPDWDALA